MRGQRRCALRARRGWWREIGWGCLVALILAACGGASKSSSVTTSRAAPAASSSTTSTAAAPATSKIRCPHKVSLPNRDRYAGKLATIFIVGSGPKKSGCRYAAAWTADWVRSGAVPGGYAAGAYVGFRCDEPLLANRGPLGGKHARYSGVIHCNQVAASAVDPQAQLDTDPAGIWAYYADRGGRPTGSGSAAAAGPAIPAKTLSRALTKQLTIYLLKAASVSCPALARRQGAAVRCRVSGKDQENSGAEAHGTATVTIEDRSGHRALASWQLTEGSGSTRGTGYPFDPDTGRTL